MRPIRARDAFAIFALTLTACSASPQPPAQHVTSSARASEARPASASAQADEGPSARLPAPTESPAESGDSAVHLQRAPARLPDECDTQSELCLPPADFVDRLCRAAHVGTAIRLFAKSSPFTRGYVRMREVRAANLRGGPVGDANLTFAEEVLLLARHGGAGEMQVSGMGGFDVLRWDGTCATLSEEELVMQLPAPPRHAAFAWRYIDDAIQEALLQNDAIRSARATQRKRCQGMSQTQRSASCREAAERLNQQIVVAIRTGMNLPHPEYTP